jgi:hypothetical protein
MTGDLAQIGSDLSQAIRREHQLRLRRRSIGRATAAVCVAACALFGAVIAGAAITGVIDLGGGHTATPVATTPAPDDPNLPYRYQLDGVHNHNGSSGPIYIESSQPLSTLTRDQIVATRTACAAKTQRIDGAIVWVFDDSCTFNST